MLANSAGASPHAGVTGSAAGAGAAVAAIVGDEIDDEAAGGWAGDEQAARSEDSAARTTTMRGMGIRPCCHDARVLDHRLPLPKLRSSRP
jgi:hypothetical protein